MRKSLLLTLLTLGIAAPAVASTPALEKTSPVRKTVPAKSPVGETVESRILPGGLKENIILTGTGLRIKTIDLVPELANVINPESRRQRRQAPPAGYALYEDFEEWDGEDEAWLPEGWTVDHKDSPASNRGWKMTQPIGMFDYIDSKCLTYELFEEEVDEWVITPEFRVSPGMELCWGAMTSPYFYNWDYFDNSSYTLTQYEIINDIRVNISTDGGETWEPLFSHAEDLIETAPNFYAMFDYSVRPFSVSIDEYAGQDVRIGFQITGTGGNTTFIDDVSVGLPTTGSAYMRPLSNLFFGLSDTDENVPASIMAGPVYAPVTYTNTTPTRNATFTWTYDDSEGEGNVSNVRDLTVTYTTDYTDAFTTRNNLYPFPVLEASSDVTAPDSFTFTGFYQAGGRGEYERYYTDTQDFEVIQLGLTVADPVTEGTATYADIALPYFGYNSVSDHFWSSYTFGDEYDEHSWAHLEKYADFFYAPDTPIVIDGIRTNAYGKISRNAVFTVEIYPINAAYMISDDPIASATCTGNDITIVDRYSSSDFLSLNFTFDEPVVISRSVTPYFLVAIGGFRDPENVEYFSPEMSDRSNPNQLGLGWIGKDIMWDDFLMPFSWTPVASYTDDELVSFYIMLDASFPWLEVKEDMVTLTPGSSATIALDSYFNGSDLQFDGMPAWLTANATGRYGQTRVTFKADADAPSGQNPVVRIQAPGFSKEITIGMQSTGIGSIAGTDADGDTAVYTLDGRKVAPERLQPGIYIRVNGGKSEKIAVR